MTARQYLGTPFLHQGRVKDGGVDCIGLLAGVAKELGVPHKDSTDYSTDLSNQNLLYELKRQPCLEERPVTAKPETGDILVFRVRKRPQHVGIKTDYGFIHTHQTVNKVVEVPLNPKWEARITNVFRIKDC